MKCSAQGCRQSLNSKIVVGFAQVTAFYGIFSFTRFLVLSKKKQSAGIWFSGDFFKPVDFSLSFP
jgi:hypothetical protein